MAQNSGSGIGWILAAVLGGLLLARSSLAKGGGGSGGGGAGGGGGGGLKPSKGPGGKGKVWSSSGSVVFPQGFDFAGNGLYIDPTCDFVIEGNLFWPTSSQLDCVEAASLQGVLSIPGNSVCGFLDYLIDTEGLQQPGEIAFRILQEASPQCASVGSDMWGPGLSAWYENFLDRVIDYTESFLDFGGE